MANGVEKESGLMMFSDEELREISGVKRGGDYIEVICGCTSHRYGDAVGKLRVFSNGDLEITCECTPGCNEGVALSTPSLSPVSLSCVFSKMGFDFSFCMFNAYVLTLMGGRLFVVYPMEKCFVSCSVVSYCYTVYVYAVLSQ